MKTRNLITLFSLALIVPSTSTFAKEASADPFGVRIKRSVMVQERVHSRDGDRNPRYERQETRSGGRDQREEHRDSDQRSRYERRETRSDGHDQKWEYRDRVEFRDRHQSHYVYREHDRHCDLPAHRHWRQHRHDHDGRVHFLFGWGIGPTAMFFGFPW